MVSRATHQRRHCKTNRAQCARPVGPRRIADSESSAPELARVVIGERVNCICADPLIVLVFASTPGATPRASEWRRDPVSLGVLLSLDLGERERRAANGTDVLTHRRRPFLTK